jgi:hypothetical protein
MRIYGITLSGKLPTLTGALRAQISAEAARHFDKATTD